MYQTKYKAALKKAGIKKEDLLKNTGKLYEQVVSAETALALAYKNLDKAEGTDKEAYQEEIDQIEPNLEVIDGELCKKIDKNEFWRANSLRLSQGRANKTKSAGEGTPPAEGSTPPAGEGTPPAEGSTPPAGEGTPPAEGSTPPAGEGTPPAVQEEEVPVLKSADKKAGNIVGWVLGFAVVLGATYLGVRYNNTGKWPWSRK